MKTNRVFGQYVDLGYLGNLTCMVVPQTCASGGTVLFWLKVEACSWRNGILSSREGSGNPGIRVTCGLE